MIQTDGDRSQRASLPDRLPHTDERDESSSWQRSLSHVNRFTPPMTLAIYQGRIYCVIPWICAAQMTWLRSVSDNSSSSWCWLRLSSCNSLAFVCNHTSVRLFLHAQYRTTKYCVEAATTGSAVGSSLTASCRRTLTVQFRPCDRPDRLDAARNSNKEMCQASKNCNVNTARFIKFKRLKCKFMVSRGHFLSFIWWSASIKLELSVWEAVSTFFQSSKSQEMR